MKKEEKKFNVMMWDFNSDSLEQYDILPYFRECIAKTKKRKKDVKTIEEIREIVEKESMYRFWSRCEYEMIIHGWPKHKNDEKIDIHDQVMMNLDTIVELLYNEQKL